jgi:hypothetical protein
MATLQKAPVKINFYKFVSPTKVGGISGAKDAASKTNISLQVAINKNILATNNLGATVNSIAKILTEFRNSQALLISNLHKNDKKFKAIYNKPTGGPKMGTLDEGVVPETVMPSWLESVFSIVKDFLTLAIGVPAMKWLADPQNREKIKNTIETIIKAMELIGNFISDRLRGTIDNLYDAFTSDEAWYVRLGKFFKGLVNFAGLVIAIRWLTNPKKIVSDFKSVMTLFNKGLKGSKAKLSKRAKLLRGGLAVGLIATAGVGLYQGFNRPEEEEEPVEEGEDEGFSKGGRVVPQRAAGGWIHGPMSGYPVSMDGGRSTSFIGHGTEYVAPARSGGGFVIPFNTPATKNNPGLTNRRMGEASRMGFDLGGLLGRGKTDPSVDHLMPKMAAGGKMPSITSNGGGNRRMELGKRYKWSDLAPHHSNEGQIRRYAGIPIGHPKDYGVGEHPSFMPSGPNGRIITPQSGKVIYSDPESVAQGYGNTVVIKGPLGHMQFSHMQRKPRFRKGQNVSKGTVLGIQGDTGKSTAEHLHLNASKKGHEAYVNYHTLGRSRTSRSGGGNESTRPVPRFSGTLTGSVDNRKRTLAHYLKRKYGLISIHSAAIVGTWSKEGFGGGHPDVREGGERGAPTKDATNRQGYGWGQWTNVPSRHPQGRLNLALKHLGMYNNPRPWTDQDNLKWFDHEIKGSYRNVLPALKKQTTLRDSVRWFTGLYEAGGMNQIQRYEEQERNNPTHGGFIGRRLAGAKKVLGLMNGGGGDDEFGMDEMHDDTGSGPSSGSMPTNPMDALKSLQTQMSSIFGGGSNSEPTEAPPTPTSGTGASVTGGADSAKDGAHFARSGSSSTPTAADAKASSAGSSTSSVSPAAGSATMAGGPAGANAITSRRSAASGATGAGGSTSSQILSQTKAASEARQQRVAAQTQAIRDAQLSAAASQVRMRQLNQESQKAIADAQSAANNQKPTVVGGNGSHAQSLVSRLGSDNNLLKSRT